MARILAACRLHPSRGARHRVHARRGGVLPRLERACNPYVTRSLHPTACLAARAGICAQEQGLFWKFADRCFALQGPAAEAAVLGLARQIGLDMKRFDRCLAAEATGRALAEDISLAHAAGVRATPTLLVNGWTFEGALPRPRLEQLLAETRPCGCDRRLSDGTCGEEKKK